MVLGPVAVGSAKAWLGYARRVVADLEFLAPDDCVTTPEVLAVFDGYLTAWEQAADGKDVFLWARDIPAEQVEYHLHAFQKVAGVLVDRAERTGVRHAPEEGEDFYAALLQGVLSALEAEGPSSAAFAQHLGEFWPGREERQP